MDATGVAQPQHIENSNNNSSSTSSNNNNNSSNDNTTTTNGNVVGVGATELAAVAEELSKTAAKVRFPSPTCHGPERKGLQNPVGCRKAHVGLVGDKSVESCGRMHSLVQSEK